MTHETPKDQFSVEPAVALSSASGEFMRVLKKLEELLTGGLLHGFFECTVACEIISGQKRRVVIKAGESYQFVIPREEIDNFSKG
jgi:hypothetical protein